MYNNIEILYCYIFIKMKAALCFLISYDHVLNKENIWREWIEPNKDIINVYFFYKDWNKIKSPWIRAHTLPPNMIVATSYFHVVPAYLSLYEFAVRHDADNQWFCMLTDACCPIISPKRFRKLFSQYGRESLLNWKRAWWNPHLTHRANLLKLPPDLWLGHDPWFILSRQHVCTILGYVQWKPDFVRLICQGRVANESVFAIILKLCNELDHVHLVSTHLTDWSRTTSTTSPHLFKEANEQDIQFLKRELERNPAAMFVRKVAPEFPDDILRHFIYEYRKDPDDPWWSRIECLSIALFGLLLWAFLAAFK
jgi:hypothetical protein